MKNIIVTGGCGFIGSHIVDNLVSLGHNVNVIDDLSAEENESFYYNQKACYWKKDISKDDCSAIFQGIDCVFHLAARSRIQPTITSPSSCFEVNVIGTQRVLEWSKVNSIRRVIYSSTSSLYGRHNSVPFEPNMPADCLNPYSLSKWMGEQACKLYTQLYGLDTTVLRYFNVYGPREPIRGKYAPIIGLFKRQKKENKPLTIVGDGLQKRDFTYISDVIEANMKSMVQHKDGFKIYNIGTGKNYSILEIANILGGNKKHLPPRPAEVRETLADISDTSAELNWKPRHDLRNMILSY